MFPQADWPACQILIVRIFWSKKVTQLELLPQRRESTATSLLQRPEFFLAALADAIHDEIAFMTEDLGGRIVYLSRSAERVLNHNPAGLLNRQFSETMTDHPSNDQVRSFPSNLRYAPTGRICEIFDRDGRRVQLMFWRVPIFHHGIPIGTAGILRRLNQNTIDSEDLTAYEENELMKRVHMLSNVERQVIELVVDGHMNKKMASILDVAVRTIESRRSRAMIKLQARSLSELVQIWVHVRRIEARMRAAQLSAVVTSTVSAPHMSRSTATTSTTDLVPS